MLTRDDLDKIYANPFPRITIVQGEYYVEQGSGQRFHIYPPDASLLNACLFDTLSPVQKRDMDIACMRAYERYGTRGMNALEELLIQAPLSTD